VEQALRSQVDRCLFHNAEARPLTLLSDYECGPEQLPTRTALILAEGMIENKHSTDVESVYQVRASV